MDPRREARRQFRPRYPGVAIGKKADSIVARPVIEAVDSPVAEPDWPTSPRGDRGSG